MATNLTNSMLVSLVHLEQPKSTTSSSSSSSSSSSLLLGFDDSTILQIPNVPLTSICSVVKSANGLKKIEAALGALKVNLLHEGCNHNGDGVKIEKFIFSQQNIPMPTSANENHTTEKSGNSTVKALVAFAIDASTSLPIMITMNTSTNTTNTSINKIIIISNTPSKDITLLDENHLLLLTVDNHVKILKSSGVLAATVDDDTHITSVKLPPMESTGGFKFLTSLAIPIESTKNNSENTLLDKENHHPLSVAKFSAITCMFSLFYRSSANDENSISSFCVLNSIDEGKEKWLCAYLEKFRSCSDEVFLMNATALSPHSSGHLLDSSKCLYYSDTSMSLRYLNSSLVHAICTSLRSGMSSMLATAWESKIDSIAQGMPRYLQIHKYTHLYAHIHKIPICT